MSTLVGELTKDELSDMIEEIVERKISELFIDEDTGLKLKGSVVNRLKKQLHSTKKGNHGIKLETIESELGI